MSTPDWSRLILLSVLWGGSFFFVGVAVGHLPPLTIVLVRVGLATLILGAVLAATRASWPPGGRVWAALVVMGLLNNVIPFTLFAVAQGQIGAGLAAILNATTPLWALLAARAVTPPEAITAPRLAGLTLGLAGVAVLSGGGTGSPGAILACVAAAASYGAASIWGRRFGQAGVAPLAVAWGQCTCSSLVILPLALIFDQPWDLPAPPLTVWAALVGLAALSTALAYLIYFRLLASAGAVNLSLVTFLIPVSALALGVGILGEDVGPAHLAGLALIGAALALTSGRGSRR